MDDDQKPIHPNELDIYIDRDIVQVGVDPAKTEDNTVITGQVLSNKEATNEYNSRLHRNVWQGATGVGRFWVFTTMKWSHVTLDYEEMYRAALQAARKKRWEEWRSVAGMVLTDEQCTELDRVAKLLGREYVRVLLRIHSATSSAMESVEKLGQRLNEIYPIWIEYNGPRGKRHWQEGLEHVIRRHQGQRARAHAYRTNTRGSYTYGNPSKQACYWRHSRTR